MEEEFDYILEPDVGFHQVFDMLPYSHWRIKQILNDNFNMHLVCIRGYKEGRYAGYKQHYELRKNGTNEVVNPCIYLDNIRSLFAKYDIPLHAYPVEEDLQGRNKGAQAFMDAVSQISIKGES